MASETMFEGEVGKSFGMLSLLFGCVDVEWDPSKSEMLGCLSWYLRGKWPN